MKGQKLVLTGSSMSKLQAAMGYIYAQYIRMIKGRTNNEGGHLKFDHKRTVNKK